MQINHSLYTNGVGNHVIIYTPVLHYARCLPHSQIDYLRLWLVDHMIVQSIVLSYNCIVYRVEFEI